jgi:hypothetical protein
MAELFRAELVEVLFGAEAQGFFGKLYQLYLWGPQTAQTIAILLVEHNSNFLYTYKLTVL